MGFRACHPNVTQMSAQNKINKSKVNKNKDILSTDVDGRAILL
jgi:hypothetical protein